jgi:hypothetical protein
MKLLLSVIVTFLPCCAITNSPGAKQTSVINISIMPPATSLPL